jgi:hypothetical protein
MSIVAVEVGSCLFGTIKEHLIQILGSFQCLLPCLENQEILNQQAGVTLLKDSYLSQTILSICPHWHLERGSSNFQIDFFTGILLRFEDKGVDYPWCPIGLGYN